MAKAKYTKGADGYFTTKTWDGSYNQDGTKHRVTLRSKKSSADLEKQVIELKAKIRNGDAIRGSDTYLPADPAYLPAGHPIRNLRPPLAGKRLPDDLRGDRTAQV